MKKIILMGVFALTVNYVNAQQWTGSGIATGVIQRTGNVEIGTTSTPSFSDKLTVEGNVSIISSSPTANKLINGRSSRGALGIYAGYGTTDGAGITLNGNDASGHAGGIHFTSIDATVGNPNDKAFSFSLYNHPTLNNLMTIYKDGSVAIGTTAAMNNTKLAVEGLIACHELKVIPSGSAWPDYVFANDYKMKSLDEVEEYIVENKHLPQLPSAAVVEKDGFKIGETQTQMLQALEELYLHVIDLKKENELLKKEVNALKK